MINEQTMQMTEAQLIRWACEKATQHLSEFTPEEIYDLQSATESLAALFEQEFETRGLEVVWRKDEAGNGRHPVVIPKKEHRADDMYDLRAPWDQIDSEGNPIPPFDSEGHPI